MQTTHSPLKGAVVERHLESAMRLGASHQVKRFACLPSDSFKEGKHVSSLRDLRLAGELSVKGYQVRLLEAKLEALANPKTPLQAELESLLEEIRKQRQANQALMDKLSPPPKKTDPAENPRGEKNTREVFLKQKAVDLHRERFHAEEAVDQEPVTLDQLAWRTNFPTVEEFKFGCADEK